MNILVVDDDVVSRRTIEHVLKSYGYNVYSVDNGRDAWALLHREAIQLVISDWSMPGMDGLELCRSIRSSDLGHYVYFIMLSCHDKQSDVIQGLDAGVDDYIAKPFNPAELLMRVKTGQRIISLETRDMTIFALAKLADSRDPETGAHLERVRSYCWILAVRLRDTDKFGREIDNEFVRLIYETSPLHDIGKVAIPDSVLLKPGKLTDEEFELMKTHAVRGAETLAAAIKEYPRAKFLRMAHDIALCHHERFNGTGYPLGLSGENIPLCARVIALADVYDALTSKRVYKDAFSHEKAKSIIMEEVGKHFDPDVVQAFLDSEDEFQAVRSRYEDEVAPVPYIPQPLGVESAVDSPEESLV